MSIDKNKFKSFCKYMMFNLKKNITSVRSPNKNKTIEFYKLCYYNNSNF